MADEAWRDESESRAVTHRVSTCVGARCFGTAASTQTIMVPAPSSKIVRNTAETEKSEKNE